MTLRGLLLSALGLMGLYAVGLAVIIGVEVLRPARALQEAAAPVARVHRLLDARSQALSGSMVEVRRLVEGEESLDPARLERLWEGLLPAPEERPTRSYAAVPAELRGPLVRADLANARLADELLETLLLLRLDRVGDARSNLPELAEVHRAALDLLGRTQEQGLQHVVGLEEEMAASAAVGLWRVFAWALTGVLLLPVFLLVARRRVAVPLRELDAAVARVAAGDLDVELQPRFDDELGGLATQFNRMIRVIRARTMAQGHLAAAGELLSGVAHEVKNPLMAIAAVAASRLDEAGASPEEREDWAAVRLQARRAGKIVQDLLRFVKGEEKDAVRTVLLQGKLDQAVSLVSYRFTVDEIDFEMVLPDEPVWVRAAPDRLEQVLVNLFSNALNALGRVEPPRGLRLECRVEGDRAVLAVVDRGPGVSPAIEPRLFNPFAGEGSGGTGLGLYISRNLMSDMGGGLRYVPEDAPGARFEAWMRLEEAPADEAHLRRREEAPPEPGDGEITVLLVEDEPMVRRPIARFLARRGLAVVEAADGAEALERMENGSVPDVVVSDLRMPRMGGLELLEELERRYPWAKERFLILSGDISMFSGIDAPLPAERVLVKPIELDELVSRIRSLAGKTGAPRV